MTTEERRAEIARLQAEDEAEKKAERERVRSEARSSEAVKMEAYQKRCDEILDAYEIPKEFRQAIRIKAWDDGHACGYGEAESILERLADLLAPAIRQFETRVASPSPAKDV
jgi:hypothetical protein